MPYLILVRHGKSEWNEKGLWTGWENPELTEEGKADAKRAGESIKDIDIDIAYSSVLKRVTETLRIIKETLGLQTLPTIEDQQINERDYGDFTGKNKWEIQKQVGEEEFKKIRRSWDHPIPNGETMKNVYERVIPYFKEHILKDIQDNKNVLVVSSGNALRAIVKYLEDLDEEQLANLEIGIGEVYVYEMDSRGKVLSKGIRSENPNKGKV